MLLNVRFLCESAYKSTRMAMAVKYGRQWIDAHRQVQHTHLEKTHKRKIAELDTLVALAEEYPVALIFR